MCTSVFTQSSVFQYIQCLPRLWQRISLWMIGFLIQFSDILRGLHGTVDQEGMHLFNSLWNQWSFFFFFWDHWFAILLDFMVSFLFQLHRLPFCCCMVTIKTLPLCIQGVNKQDPQVQRQHSDTTFLPDPMPSRWQAVFSSFLLYSPVSICSS